MAPETRRAQIVDVATRLISAGGFKAFTLSRLAEECEMTRKGVEHYFQSSEDILVAVLEHRDEVDQHDFAFRERLPLSQEDLWDLLDHIVMRNAERPEIIRLYTILEAEALDPGHPAFDYFQKRVTRIRRELADAVRDWHPEPDSFGVQVLAQLDGLQLLWLRDRELDLLNLWRTASVALRRPDGTSVEDGVPTGIAYRHA